MDEAPENSLTEHQGVGRVGLCDDPIPWKRVVFFRIPISRVATRTKDFDQLTGTFAYGGPIHLRVATTGQ